MLTFFSYIFTFLAGAWFACGLIRYLVYRWEQDDLPKWVERLLERYVE